MEKPSKVSIMGIPFEVKHPVNVDKDKSYGESHGPERTIKIKRSLTGEVYEATLLHEVLHSILYTTGLSEVLEDAVEEAIVVALEHGLTPLYERKDWR